MIKLEYGKRYVTRNGLVTNPLGKAKDGTNYKFESWIQEPEFPDLSWRSWLETGEFMAPSIPHRLDLVALHEPT